MSGSSQRTKRKQKTKTMRQSVNSVLMLLLLLLLAGRDVRSRMYIQSSTEGITELLSLVEKDIPAEDDAGEFVSLESC